MLFGHAPLTSYPLAVSSVTHKVTLTLLHISHKKMGEVWKRKSLGTKIVWFGSGKDQWCSVRFWRFREGCSLPDESPVQVCPSTQTRTSISPSFSLSLFLFCNSISPYIFSSETDSDGFTCRFITNTCILPCCWRWKRGWLCTFIDKIFIPLSWYIAILTIFFITAIIVVVDSDYIVMLMVSYDYDIIRTADKQVNLWNSLFWVVQTNWTVLNYHVFHKNKLTSRVTSGAPQLFLLKVILCKLLLLSMDKMEMLIYFFPFGTLEGVLFWLYLVFDFSSILTSH